MAKILFCWELGGGLGHLSSFAPFAGELRARGHDVRLVVRNPGAVPIVLGEGWPVFPAPLMEEPAEARYSPTSSYVRLLWNAAWGSRSGLDDRLRRWREILTSFSPHLAVFDHAPTALLAARGLEMGTLMLGAPFCCPGALGPFGDFFGENAAQQEEEERSVRERVNAVLARLGWREVGSLQDVFRVDEVHLTSFPELDPFERRQAPCYLGHFPGSQGARAKWPSGKPGARRVFAYLKEGPVAERVIAVLARLRIPSLVYLAGRTQEAGETVVVSKEPIEMESVARECDLAITHATHGTAACLLTAGKPMLLFPRFLEQHLTARKVVDLGAGRLGQASSLRALGEGIAQLLEEPRFLDAARRIAGRYSSYSARASLLSSVESMERLAGSKGPSAR